MNLEIAQLRQALRRAVMEREQYVRVAILLAKAIETQTDDALIRVEGGKIALRRAAFEDVPKKYGMSLRNASVKLDGDPNAIDEAVIVVSVEDVKPKPTLVVANGVSNGGIALP